MDPVNEVPSAEEVPNLIGDPDSGDSEPESEDDLVDVEEENPPKIMDFEAGNEPVPMDVDDNGEPMVGEDLM